MHILLTGGGSGGHVTPLLAVAHELKKQDPQCILSYIGEKGGDFGRLIEESGHFTHIIYVQAGKFRRYHDESLLQKMFDVKTNALNVRDAFRTVVGVAQAHRALKKHKPDVVFAKGGFVCVPVGIAARLQRISLITHDSDVLPGLANRIISRWAAVHATGFPEQFYEYPKNKTVFVGVPVAAGFVKATPNRVEKARSKLAISKGAKVVLVTGGSQGSTRINQIVHSIAPQLLEDENVVLIHHVGKGNEGLYGEFNTSRLRVAAFFDNFAEIAAASDVVVSRAGANSVTEFGLLEKAVIVIPSPFLAGGHQLKNASQLAKNHAIIELDERKTMENPAQLLTNVRTLLYDTKKRTQLAAKLRASTKPGAAENIAALIFKLGEEES